MESKTVVITHYEEMIDSKNIRKEEEDKNSDQTMRQRTWNQKPW